MPIRGEASAKLADDRTLTICINFAVLAKSAADTGIPAQEMFGVLAKDDGRQLLVMLTLLVHGLQKYHRGITEDEIGELMLSDGEALGLALGKALSGAFGEEEAGDDAPPNPPKPKPRGTGAGSRERGRKRA